MELVRCVFDGNLINIVACITMVVVDVVNGE